MQGKTVQIQRVINFPELPKFARRMHTYLNTAAFGLMDAAAKAAGDAFYTALAASGSSVAEEWRAEAEPRIRATVASFLGAGPENVALVPAFSWGLNALVQSLDGSERVLLYRGDYPSLLEPFQLNGFAICWIDAVDDFALPLDAIERCIRNREVDVVALSHVQYNSGYRLPLAELGALCKAHGVRFIVDATQSMGALSIDVSQLNLDALIASHYKWMNAGFGSGSLYVSDDFLHRYPPVVGGANSYSHPGVAWQEKRPVRGYEPGHPNMYGLTILEAAVLQKQQRGIAAIEAHNARLTRLLLDGIQDLGLPSIGPATIDDRASIVLLREPAGLADWIRQAGITVTARGGRIRISLHRYNDDGDVVRLVECLRAFGARR